MDKQHIFDVVRNCLAAFGLLELGFSLYNFYLLLEAKQMELGAYLHIALAFLALFVAMFWTMIEREKTLKKEAETNFFQRYPEYKDYKYFWELYGLYRFGKSLSGIPESRFIQWKLEIAYCLREWGESKNKDFALNLPPHATATDYLNKLEETLNDHAKVIGF